MSDAVTWSHAATRLSDGRPRLASGEDGASARVHSCFRSAVNITTPDGLLTIASEAVGGLPNGIVADLAADFRELGIRAGMTVEAGDRALFIPGIGLRLDLAGAVVWSPRIPPPGDGFNQAGARWRQRSQAARACTLLDARAGGLAGLLGTTMASRPAGSVDVTERARPVLMALVRALVKGDRSAASESARGLIGLGPGLTPSGDDVLVGIEAALHVSRWPMAGFVSDALDRVEDRTTAVAATLLSHAARGEFTERLHVLLAVLLGPDDAAIPGAIERAVAWGATSGSDCLVGVLYGLDIATWSDAWLA